MAHTRSQQDENWESFEHESAITEDVCMCCFGCMVVVFWCTWVWLGLVFGGCRIRKGTCTMHPNGNVLEDIADGN